MTVLKMSRDSKGKFTAKSHEVKKPLIKVDNVDYAELLLATVLLAEKTEKMSKSIFYMRIAIWTIFIALAITMYALLSVIKMITG